MQHFLNAACWLLTVPSLLTFSPTWMSLCHCAFPVPCVLTDQRRSSRPSVNRTHTAGKKWCFPVFFFFFYWEYKDQEAESSLGISGLIVEAVSLLVHLEMEMGSVGDTLSHMIFPLLVSLIFIPKVSGIVSYPHLPSLHSLGPGEQRGCA